jgi:hypothetical protein
MEGVDESQWLTGGGRAVLIVLRFLKVNTRRSTCMPDKDISHLPRQTIMSARHPEGC